MSAFWRKPRCKLIAVWTLLAISKSVPVSAQEWLIVPVRTPEHTLDLEPSILALEAALRDRSFSVRDGAEAAERFERVESAPAESLSKEVVSEWSERSRRALHLLAKNDYEGAERELEPALSLTRESVEVLNRDRAHRKAVLDTCLFQVRALLGQDKRATARLQARECARWSPGTEPDVKMHPPDVRTFYDDVLGAAVGDTGSLLIESDPSGCTARVNGVGFGNTPARVERLQAGPYAVQVECAPEPGRIHHLLVERGATELRVDARFDEAVETDGRVRMSYAASPPADQRTSDARRLARVLDLDTVLFVVPNERGSLDLQRMDASGHQRGTAEIPMPVEHLDAQGVDQALDRLLGIETRNRHGPPRAQFIAGVSFAAAGAASLLTGYALYAASATKQADRMIASPSNANQATWLNTRFGMFYVGSAGAAMLVTAMPLALPYRPRPPWWAWLSGGLGLALAATSIGLAVTAPPSPDVSRVADPEGYVDRAKRTDAAFLTGVTAAPLLTMPLVYLLRRDSKKGRAELVPQLHVGRSGGSIGLSGTY